MAYGTVKVDNITFDNGGSDQNVTVSGLYRATTSGVTVSGTIAATIVSGVTVIGSTTVSGDTVTGTTANFTSGNFSNIISSAATMSGALIMANQQQVQFRESGGTNHIALRAPTSITNDQIITLPEQTGTLITTGDNGSVSSTMLATNLTISAAAGSASTPSIAFTGDLNTGIYSPGADQLAVSTGGTGRLFIDSSGRLLIGTSTGRNIADGVQGGIQYETTEFGGISVTNNRNDESAATLTFGKQRSGSVGGTTIVQNGDPLGTIAFGGADGTDLETRAASISCIVDGTPGANDMPGRLVFSTTADGASSPTERMRIDSSGNVGIGTSSPAARLQVNQAIPNGTNTFGVYPGIVQIYNSQGISNSDTSVKFVHNFSIGDVATGEIGTLKTDYFASLSYRMFFRTGGTERMTIDSSGNVGIGTSGPGYALDVAAADATANIGYAARIRANTTAGAGALQFTDSAATAQYGLLAFRQNGVGVLQADGASSALIFSTNSTERLRIDSSGRLLVGTSSASESCTLILEGYNATSNTDGILRLHRSTTSPPDGQGLGNITFGTPGTSNFKGAAWILGQRDGGIWINGTSHPGRLVFSTTADGASSPTERMRIASNGNIFVNTISNPTTINKVGIVNILSDEDRDAVNIKHEKDGNNSINIWQTGTNTFNALHFFKGNSQTGVGTISVSTTGTSYNTVSDYRIKENVTPLTGAIDRLKDLQVHSFNFIADPDRTVDGFIAHEVQAVVPECATGEKDAVDEQGNPVYQGIDQSKLVPLLTAALQEAIAKIETLEAKVAALEGA